MSNDCNYHALMQDMWGAFETGAEYTLTAYEVETVYLALARLKEIEAAAMKRDWAAVETLTPSME